MTDELRDGHPRSGDGSDPGLAGVVPFTWACRRSGRCCGAPEGYVFLAAGEVPAMAAALGLEEATFRAAHVRTVPDPRAGGGAPVEVLAERLDGRCTLLEGRAECTVYAARPEHCRRFPYWAGVLGSADDFEAARVTCPGIAVRVGRGRREAALARLDALARRLARDAAQDGGRCELATTCALPPERDGEHFVTGLEADWVVARANAPGSPGTSCPWRVGSGPGGRRCTAGAGRPFACRLRALFPDDAERERRARDLFAELRSLSRALHWPSSYGRLHEQAASRAGGAGPTPGPG